MLNPPEHQSIILGQYEPMMRLGTLMFVKGYRPTLHKGPLGQQ
jgi:hypothetical protein